VGRGDRKTTKGKIAKRSYGNKRPKTKTAAGTKAVSKPAVAKKPVAAPAKPAAPKPAAPKKKV
jgi:ribosomal small subunit protein bTHX